MYLLTVLWVEDDGSKVCLYSHSSRLEKLDGTSVELESLQDELLRKAYYAGTRDAAQIARHHMRGEGDDHVYGMTDVAADRRAQEIELFLENKMKEIIRV
jgi:hypothetical protein